MSKPLVHILKNDFYKQEFFNCGKHAKSGLELLMELTEIQALKVLVQNSTT